MRAIIIDSREQLPFLFKRWGVPCYRDTLKTGDYSVHDYEQEIAVERKGLGDFLNSVGRNHRRFDRELQRLSDFRFKMLVVESEARRALKPEAHPYTSLHRNQVCGSLVKIMADYGIPVLFADTRRVAEELTYRFLKRSHEAMTRDEEISVLPFSLRKRFSICSLCCKTRMEAIAERPGINRTNWLREAEYKRNDGRLVLGKRLMICYQCQAKIRNKTATLPPGFRWVRK